MELPGPGAMSKAGPPSQPDMASALASALSALGQGPPGAPPGAAPGLLPPMMAPPGQAPPPGLMPPPPMMLPPGLPPGVPGMQLVLAGPLGGGMPPPPPGPPPPDAFGPGMLPPPCGGGGGGRRGDSDRADRDAVCKMFPPAKPGGKRYPLEGTSGQECRFGRSCKNAGCADSHPGGRSIDDDPSITLCRFGRKCKRDGCFFMHPQGREVDEDPSKGVCRQGLECRRPDCLYTHPPGHIKVGNETRICHVCGGAGHIMRDCPKQRKGSLQGIEFNATGQYVMMSDFPKDWLELPTDKFEAQIAAELEVFGTLSQAPKIFDLGHKAVACFADPDLAKTAVEALDDSEFRIELFEPPASCSLDPSVLLQEVPVRWTGSDIAALLHGVVKPSTLLGIDMLPEEEIDGKTWGASRVKFRDIASAREAARELEGQKVAGRPLQVTLENADEDKRPKEALSTSWGWKDRSGPEMCNDFKRGLCNRGDRCKFSHGEENDREKQERRGDWDRDRDRRSRDRYDRRSRGRSWDRDRDRRSRSRDRRRRDREESGDEGDARWDRDDRRGERDDRRRGGERPTVVVLHVDEIPMPRRPEVDPAPTDREVYVDPLPEEDLLGSCISAFGQEEEVYRLTGPGTRRGYVKFRHHGDAARCVEAGFGSWSESERTLSSQRSRRAMDGTISTYPDSIIARLVGSGGESIRKLKEECGVNWLHLRGEDLGHSDGKFSNSSRVHFIAEGDDASLRRMRQVLEKRLAEIHDGIRERLDREGDRNRERRDRDGDRDRAQDASGAAAPWRPPGADAAPWKPPGAPAPGADAVAPWKPPADADAPWRPPGGPPAADAGGGPAPGKGGPAPWAAPPPPWAAPPCGPPGFSPWSAPPPACQGAGGPPGGPPRPGGGSIFAPGADGRGAAPGEGPPSDAPPGAPPFGAPPAPWGAPPAPWSAPPAGWGGPPPGWGGPPPPGAAGGPGVGAGAGGGPPDRDRSRDRDRRRRRGSSESSGSRSRKRRRR